MDRMIKDNVDLAFIEFLAGLTPIETSLELPPPTAEFVAMAREVAFRAGWDAHRKHSSTAEPTKPILKDPIVEKVSVMVDVDDQAFVHPFAIVEDTGTGERFVEIHHPVRFDVTDRRLGVVLRGERPVDDDESACMHEPRGQSGLEPPFFVGGPVPLQSGPDLLYVYLADRRYSS